MDMPLRPADSSSTLETLDEIYASLKAQDAAWLEETLTERLHHLETAPMVPRTAGNQSAPRTLINDDATCEHSTVSALLAEKLDACRNEARERESRFRKMADGAPVPMYEVAADGSLNYANEAWWKFTAHSRDRMAPLEWTDVIHESDRPWFASQWQRLVSGETLNFEIRFATPYISDDYVNGERLKGITWGAASAYAEFNADGTVRNVLGCVSDISRHKWIEDFQARETQRAVELKKQQETFMDMTSHEARNPLAAISLSIEGILDAFTNLLDIPGDQVQVSRDTIETTLDNANTIMACVSHQKSIIDDVLTLSKLDSGMLMTSPVKVQPREEIAEVLKMFDGEVQQADLDLQYVVDSTYAQHMVDWVLLDPVRFKQIVMNLLTNALKFTKDEATRRITVILAASPSRPSSDMDGLRYIQNANNISFLRLPGDVPEIFISVTVKDTGRGIEADSLQSLFERFKQGSPKTHVKYGGSGLGLFICKELARIQGGQMGVSSVHGQGSTFSFYVSAARTTAPQIGDMESMSGTVRRKASQRVRKVSTAGPKSPMPATTPWEEKFYILLVEDNLVNQKVMAKQLERAGYVVSLANHGQEALDHLRTTHFCNAPAPLDVVLMDIEMPVMGGLECTRRIRAMEQSGEICAKVPLIAVTANARAEQQNDAIHAGVDAVITKPFRMNALLPELERFCLGEGS